MVYKRYRLELKCKAMHEAFINIHLYIFLKVFGL